MLQQDIHRNQREQHKVAQFEVNTTELAYLVGQSADNTNQLSSKIMVDLWRVEVLECAAMVPAVILPRMY